MTKIHPMNECIICLRGCNQKISKYAKGTNCSCEYFIHKKCVNQIKHLFDNKCPICKKTFDINPQIISTLNNIYHKNTKHVFTCYEIKQFKGTYTICIKKIYIVKFGNRVFEYRKRFNHKTYSQDNFISQINLLQVIKDYETECIKIKKTYTKGKKNISKCFCGIGMAVVIIALI